MLNFTKLVFSHWLQKSIKKTSKFGSKNQSKINKNRWKNVSENMLLFNINFCWFLAPFCLPSWEKISGFFWFFANLAPRGAQERSKSDFRVDLRASRLDFEASWPLFWTLQALFSRLLGLILVALGLILEPPWGKWNYSHEKEKNILIASTVETTQNKRPKPKPMPKPRLKAKLQPKPKQSRARANYRHTRCISSLHKTKQGEPKAGTK